MSDGVVAGAGAGRSRARSEARRDEILDAAARLFAERGYHGVTIDDIGAAVGMTGERLPGASQARLRVAVHAAIGLLNSTPYSIGYSARPGDAGDAGSSGSAVAGHPGLGGTALGGTALRGTALGGTELGDTEL